MIRHPTPQRSALRAVSRGEGAIRAWAERHLRAERSRESSLHAALYAAICGVVRRVKGAPTGDEKLFAQRHKPWMGEDRPGRGRA